MFTYKLANCLEKKPQILLLGAHCDDIEIGCGGAILHLLNAVEDAKINWVVFSSSDIRRKEAEGSALSFLEKAGKHNIQILNYRNSFFPSEYDKIKEYFEELKNSISPSLIFTHYRDDLHQDHRVINQLTWNTFRDHQIYEYEIPKYDGDIGRPNYYMPLSEEIKTDKIKKLLHFYQSQKKRSWFTEETFAAMMRIRGVECNAEEGYAEAFFARKIVVE